MALIDITELPSVVGLAGTERVPLDQAGTTKHATTRQLLAATTPNLGTSPTPSTNFNVNIVKISDGLAYSVTLSEFMTALHGIPGGGTTGQILGKLSNADYDVNWISAGTVFSVGLSMPAVFTVTNSPITSSGTIAVTANGTSGGIPYFSSSSTFASSAVLAANQIVLGGGAGTTPATLGSLGTTSTVLHGNASGAPTFGAVVLTTDVSGILPVANGGTGVNSLTSKYLLIGNGTSPVTLLAPSATSGIPLVSQGSGSDPAYSTAVVAGGGTGLTSATAYAVLCGGTTSTGAFQSVASVGTAGQILTSNGAGALPTFQSGSSALGQAFTANNDTNVTATLGGAPTTAVLSAMSFTLGWTGQLALTRGGTAASLTASNGGIVYSGASALAILAGTATANQILVSGSSSAPSWSTSSYPASSAAGTVLASLTANTITATALPVLGASGTATGKLGLSGTTSGTVTVQPQDAAGTYNFNLPTSAGTSGQPLLSGGGGSSPMTFGTLGVAAGGTGATTLTANAVLLGNGTSAVAFATIGTSGRLLIDQGAASNPSFNAMSGDATITNLGALTIANNAVTYAKFQQAAGLTLLGVTGSSTANYGAITGTANQLPFVNSGGTSLAFGSLSTLLDNVLSSTQGSIVYRGSSTWSALSPGSSGQFLQTQGAGLNPSWAAAAGGGSVTSVTASSQGLTINGVGGAAGGSFNVSGTITPIQTINAQTGTTYTVLSTDHTKLVAFSNTSAVAVTLPQANGAGFNAGFWWDAENISSGTVTITPTTSTIDGAVSVTLLTGQGIRITSDGTNYYTQRGVTALGFETPRNLGLTASVGSSALTITLTDALGNTPNGGSPVLIPFRNATIATGTPVWRAVTGSTTLVISSGSTLGTASSSVPFRVWVVAFDDAGTIRLGAFQTVTGGATPTAFAPLAESSVASSTAEGGAGGADSPAVFYTGTAVSSKAYRIIAYMDWSSGLATAGTWASGPTTIQMFGPGIKKSGDVVQTIYFTTTSQTNTTSSTFQNTAVTASISPTAAMNPIRVTITGPLTNSNGALTQAVMQIFRSSTAIGVATINGATGTSAASQLAFDAPGTTSSTSYIVKIRSTDNATNVSFPFTGTAALGGTMMIEELMI